MAKITKHDIIVRNLEERLSQNPKYDIIITDLMYNEGKKKTGQVDLLAYSEKHNTYYFFEVKCNNNDKLFIKAIHQYHRYCRAYPMLNIKGVYVTPTKVRRLRWLKIHISESE